jgi:putative ABC transport system permease protein
MSLKGETRTAAFLAIKDILKDKKVALLVVSVLSFSFVNLIFFTSFNYGLENTIEDQLINTIVSHLVIEPKEGEKFIERVSNIERKIELIPGVIASSPHIKWSGAISHKGKTVLAWQILGITPSKERMVTVIPEKIVSGEFLSDSDRNEVVLGKQLAGIKPGEEGFDIGELFPGLQVDVGDRVVISYGNGVKKEYRVKGIYETGMMDADFSAYLTTREVESVLGIEDKATEILVRLNDRSAAEEYKLKVMQGIPYEVKTWKDKAEFVEQITSSMRMITTITGSVGILTVAVTIAIIIYINTTYKKRLIGVLKAIGASDSVILRIFLYEAIIFSIFGILAGIGISYLLDSYISANPIVLPMGEVSLDVRADLLLTSSIAVVLSAIFAGFYPSWKASRQSIIKSIWGE